MRFFTDKTNRFSSFPHGTFHYRKPNTYLDLEGGPLSSNSFSPILHTKISASPKMEYHHLKKIPNVNQTSNILLGGRSPLLAKSRLISFPLVIEMFHFTRFLS